MHIMNKQGNVRNSQSVISRLFQCREKEKTISQPLKDKEQNQNMTQLLLILQVQIITHQDLKRKVRKASYEQQIKEKTSFKTK